MKSYLLYKDKSLLEFKKLLNSGNLFDNYRSLVTSFLRYAGDDMDRNIAAYSSSVDVENIVLENVFPLKYKWMVGDVYVKNQRDYIISLVNRIDEFKGKEDNLKILVGILFIRFVLISKIVETYLAAATSYKAKGIDITNLSLKEIGLGNNVLMYFDEMEQMGEKTIDEWIAYKPDPVESKYFYSAMRRILTLLVGNTK